jgi:hypothetical protein
VAKNEIEGRALQYPAHNRMAAEFGIIEIGPSAPRADSAAGRSSMREA